MAGEAEVARQLAEKLKLEARFSPTVQRLLDRIAREAGKQYGETGVVPDVAVLFLADWRDALLTH